MILHELFRVVSCFPRYISCYIAENGFPLGQWMFTILFYSTVPTISADRWNLIQSPYSVCLDTVCMRSDSAFLSSWEDEFRFRLLSRVTCRGCHACHTRCILYHVYTVYSKLGGFADFLQSWLYRACIPRPYTEFMETPRRSYPFKSSLIGKCLQQIRFCKLPVGQTPRFYKVT